MFQVPRQVMRLPQVLSCVGLGRSALYARIQAGKFPKPIKLDPDGRAVVWFSDDITEYQRLAIERATARTAQ
jgi:prophage regulatory protein